MNNHNILTVTHLSLEPQEGYGPDAPVKVAYSGDRADANSQWGSDVDGGGVLAWRAENGDEAAIAYAAPAITAAALNAHRDQRIEAGSTFPVTGYGDVPLSGRSADKIALMGLLMKASTLKALGYTDPVLTVRDADNINHTLTPDQMIELVNAGMLWIEATMQVSWAMKDGIAPFEAGIPSDFADDAYWP